MLPHIYVTGRDLCCRRLIALQGRANLVLLVNRATRRSILLLLRCLLGWLEGLELALLVGALLEVEDFLFGLF